jgi:rhamnose transport system substrate-binding protein
MISPTPNRNRNRNLYRLFNPSRNDSPQRSRPPFVSFVTFCLILSFFFTGCSKSSDSPSPGSSSKKLTIALMPKSKGNAYFISCKQGADEAAKELGVELLFDGPTDPDPAKQNEIIENWITLGVDAIAAACENKEGISTALRKAKQKGIKVLTYDSDANPDARDFFVNQATPEGIGNTLMDEAGRLCDDSGEFAIITASLTAANMNEWQKFIEARRSSKHPNMKMVALRPCDDLKDKAQSEATALLSANPNLKLIMAIDSGGCRSRQTGWQNRRRQSHRPRPSQRKSKIRQRRRHPIRHPVENH